MFDVRLRLMNDDGTPDRVLQTVQHSWTAIGARQMRFTVPASEDVTAPFLVAVEFSTGGAYARPRDDLFLVTEDAADSIAPSGAVSFTAVSMFGWLAAGMPLWWRPGDTAELVRAYTARTPGYVLQDLITWAQNVEGSEGWGPHVTRAFTLTTDSAGNAWAETFTGSWPLFTTSLSRAIDSLTSQGYCEVWTEGFEVHAVNAGTGADRTDSMTLGGPGFSRAPGKRVFDPATGMVVQHDKGWSFIANPGAETRFGQVFKVMSQSGAPDLAAATKNAQPALAEARAMQEELSYEWTVAGDLPRPWVDFQIGDLVTARTRQGKKLLRVVGLDVSKDSKGAVTARAVVGSKILDFEAKLAKRAAAVSVGSLIGGSGATPPPTPTPAQAAPVPPEGLHVASNVGAWLPDGTAVSTVQLAWSAVTQNVDGMPVDVVAYELWARRGSEARALAVSTDALTATVTVWEPEQTRYVSARALSRAGVWSAFSDEIAVTPAQPASIVPLPPGGVHVTSNAGRFLADGTAVADVTLGWDAVTLSVDGVPVEVAEYEVMVGLAPIRVTGLEAAFTVPASATRDVTVRALTTLGTWSDPSAPVPVTGAAPAGSIAAPTPPILATGASTVTARWDGMLTTGAPPAGFGFVYMDTAPDVDGAPGAWAPFGTPLTGAGGASIRGVMDETVWVRLRSTDTLGRPGGTSTPVSILVVGTGADDIVAGSISVNHVTPSFGDDLNISANDAVVIIVGQQAQQATDLAAVQDGLTTVEDTANAAVSAAGDARSVAEGAQTAADDAMSAASDVGARLDEHQTYYRFGTTGLAIGDPNTTSELRLQPDAIQMTQNNVVISEWVGGVFIAPEARLQSASIGNHQWLPYGPGRTIVRPL